MVFVQYLLSYDPVYFFISENWNNLMDTALIIDSTKGIAMIYFIIWIFIAN
jgi:hypothetical protein